MNEDHSAHQLAEHMLPGREQEIQKAASTAPPVVCVEGLRVRYGRLEAVRGINFSIPRGEVFGFIGPNGAGKSSTIRVLATLQKEFDGRVRINGVDVRRNPGKVRTMMGYMPDFFGVYEDLTAREYLHFFAAAYKIPVSKRQSIVDDVLQLTDLTNKIDAAVDSLSRGMKPVSYTHLTLPTIYSV